ISYVVSHRSSTYSTAEKVYITCSKIHCSTGKIRPVITGTFCNQKGDSAGKDFHILSRCGCQPVCKVCSFSFNLKSTRTIYGKVVSQHSGINPGKVIFSSLIL